jgi:hypothetical protein
MKSRLLQFGGISIALLGLIGGIVQLVTAPDLIRRTSFTILFAGMLLVGLWLYGYDFWLRRRASRGLPSVERLEELCLGYRVVQATRDDIDWIARLEADTYSTGDAVPKGLLLEWFDANPNGFSVLRTKDGSRVGHIDLLPIRPATLDRFSRGEIKESEIRGDSLFPDSERVSIKTLYVESVIVKPRKGLSRGPALMSILASFPDLIHRICNAENLETIYAIAASDSGDQLLHRVGFEPTVRKDERVDHHDFFSVSFENLAKNVVNICGIPMKRFKKVANKLSK